MVKAWPSLVDRAHGLVRPWPAAIARAHLRAGLLGQVVLAVLLAVSVPSTWRDGIPTDQLPDLVAPPSTGIASMEVSTNTLSGKPHRGSPLPAIEPAPPPRPVVPTAPPVQLLIPLLDVHRAVEGIGVDQSGALSLPVNSWNAGWFQYGPVPGGPGSH